MAFPYLRFGTTCQLHLQGARNPRKAQISTLPLTRFHLIGSLTWSSRFKNSLNIQKNKFFNIESRLQCRQRHWCIILQYISFIKYQRDATYSVYFYNSTCFGRSPRPSSGVIFLQTVVAATGVCNRYGVDEFRVRVTGSVCDLPWFSKCWWVSDVASHHSIFQWIISPFSLFFVTDQVI